MLHPCLDQAFCKIWGDASAGFYCRKYKQTKTWQWPERKVSPAAIRSLTWAILQPVHQNWMHTYIHALSVCLFLCCMFYSLYCKKNLSLLSVYVNPLVNKWNKAHTTIIYIHTYIVYIHTTYSGYKSLHLLHASENLAESYNRPSP